MIDLSAAATFDIVRMKTWKKVERILKEVASVRAVASFFAHTSASHRLECKSGGRKQEVKGKRSSTLTSGFSATALHEIHTVSVEEIAALEEDLVGRVLVGEEGDHRAAVERDAPPRRDLAAVPAAERRVDQVHRLRVRDLRVQVDVLVTAPVFNEPFNVISTCLLSSKTREKVARSLRTMRRR